MKQQDEPEAAKTQDASVPEDDIALLGGLTSPRFAEEIVQMYLSGPAGPSEKKKSVTSDAVDDRPKRGQIHQEIRRIFQGRIETSTDDTGAIIATLLPPRKAKAKKRGRDSRNKRDDEKPAGEYLHFTLYKENRDTMDAINQIARFLKVKTQVIAYAGTKDRRAATSQRCSVRYTRTRNLAGINGRIWGVTTGDYDYQERPIHLGQLLGNEFVITIKECNIVGDYSHMSLTERVSKLQEATESALQHMNSHGWINYFGHQRFGTHNIGTHDIGKLILGDKYEEAVNSLLYYDTEIAAKAEKGEIPDEPTKRDEYLRHLACMLFMTGKDVNKAIETLPRRFSAETSVLRHLTRSGAQSRKDFIGALIHITRGLRSMYMHAYQSYIWNHAASKRWETHGENVVKGDLVIVQAETTPLVSGQDQDGDDIINPVEDDDNAPLQARPLTEEEASSGKYTVYDVVLPTPGYEVVYPDNEIGTFYEEFMGREENGSLDPHKMRRMKREFSLPGRYRKVMNRFLATPSVEVKTYTDDTEQMHPTDLDLIKKKSINLAKRGRDAAEDDEAASKKTKTEEGPLVENVATDVEMQEPGEAAKQETSETKEPTETREASEKIAAVVKFQLGRSAYATVALRELMGDPPEHSS